mmetsp:Transcript_5697/g.12401  ORF Transcript_5697/g.12401 Transcript_5697/m.12401 type:complete len:146 (+) Transcript_5697:93-530(+)
MLRRLTYEAVTRGSSGGGITTRHSRPRLRVFEPTSGISMRHYAACCSFALPALDHLLTNRGNASQMHRHQQHGQQHQHQQQQQRRCLSSMVAVSRKVVTTAQYESQCSTESLTVGSIRSSRLVVVRHGHGCISQTSWSGEEWSRG